MEGENQKFESSYTVIKSDSHKANLTGNVLGSLKLNGSITKKGERQIIDPYHQRQKISRSTMKKPFENQLCMDIKNQLEPYELKNGLHNYIVYDFNRIIQHESR